MTEERIRHIREGLERFWAGERGQIQRERVSASNLSKSPEERKAHAKMMVAARGSPSNYPKWVESMTSPERSEKISKNTKAYWEKVKSGELPPPKRNAEKWKATMEKNKVERMENKVWKDLLGMIV